MGSLLQLTKLKCSTVSSSADALRHLPPQLLELSISLSRAAAAADAEIAEQVVHPQHHAVSLQLGHITALQSLHVGMYCQLREASLPTSLKSLDVMGSSHNEGALPPMTALALRELLLLETVRMAYSKGSVDSAQQIQQQLGPLRQLQWMSLEYGSFADAVGPAAAWRQFSALQQLTIYGNMDDPDDEVDGVHPDHALQPEQVQQVLRGIGAATSLQYLELTGTVPAEVADVASHLTGLTNLQSLELHTYKSSSHDLLHLRALAPSLTFLSFQSPQVDDYAVVGLASKLQRLHHLSLLYGGVKTSAALLALSNLTELQELDLRDCPGPFDGHVLLELAAALPQLRQLQVSKGQFEHEALQAFWQAAGGRVGIYVSPDCPFNE
jgi:hypothetical protein